ncbi:MAG: sugar phosphate isomerase/epimerase family protein [Thermosulfidibacteraceae bacterium]|jgi:sugar phosphate isomerase/epimerase
MEILIHVTYKYLVENYQKLADRDLSLEVLFFAEDLDNGVDLNLLSSIVGVFKKKGLFLNVHAPFYDLNLGSFDRFILEAVLKRYESMLPVIKVLEPSCIVIHTGYDKWRYRSREKSWIKTAKLTLKSLDAMFPRRIKFALENVFDESPVVLEELLEGFDTSRFGYCFDIGHFHIFSRTSLEEWLLRIGDRIFELHIHDNDTLDDRHWGIGKGSAPLYSALKWALSKNVPYFTIEAHTEEDAIVSLDKLLYLKGKFLEVRDGL